MLAAAYATCYADGLRALPGRNGNAPGWLVHVTLHRLLRAQGGGGVAVTRSASRSTASRRPPPGRLPMGPPRRGEKGRRSPPRSAATSTSPPRRPWSPTAAPGSPSSLSLHGAPSRGRWRGIQAAARVCTGQVQAVESWTARICLTVAQAGESPRSKLDHARDQARTAAPRGGRSRPGTAAAAGCICPPDLEDRLVGGRADVDPPLT